jgi:hypothetical protein
LYNKVEAEFEALLAADLKHYWQPIWSTIGSRFEALLAADLKHCILCHRSLIRTSKPDPVYAVHSASDLRLISVQYTANTAIKKWVTKSGKWVTKKSTVYSV